MEQLKPPKILAPQASHVSGQLSTRPSDGEATPEQMELAMPDAKAIMDSYPDWGKVEPDGYLMRITNYLALITEEERRALAHPIAGIATRSKFLPSIADMAEFLQERSKRLNTKATGYRYLTRGEGDPDNVPPLARRRELVADYRSTHSRGALNPETPSTASAGPAKGIPQSANTKTEKQEA